MWNFLPRVILIWMWMWIWMLRLFRGMIQSWFDFFATRMMLVSKHPPQYEWDWNILVDDWIDQSKKYVSKSPSSHNNSEERFQNKSCKKIVECALNSGRSLGEIPNRRFAGGGCW